MRQFIIVNRFCVRRSVWKWTRIHQNHRPSWLTSHRGLAKKENPSNNNNSNNININMTLKENIHTIPNYLTLSRILMTPAIGYFIVDGQYKLAFGMFATAGITDLLDGYIARRYRMKTALGSVLDPLADKILMTTLTISLAISETISPYLSFLIISRDVGLVVAAAYMRYKSLPPPKTMSRYFDVTLPTIKVRPTMISKVNTFLQLVLMGCGVSALAYPNLLAGASSQLYFDGLQLLVGGTTVASAISYLNSKNSIKIILLQKRKGFKMMEKIHDRISRRNFK